VADSVLVFRRLYCVKRPTDEIPGGFDSSDKAQTLWGFFILWAAIIACPCMLFYFEATRQQVLLHLKLLPIFLAPAVLFGITGTAWMTFLVPPGRLVLAMFAGIVIGFIPPAATLWGLQSSFRRARQRWVTTS
jgi:hypothetical protein